MKKRVNYTSGFKSKVVLEALQERETIQEIGKKSVPSRQPGSSWCRPWKKKGKIKAINSLL